MSSFDATDIRRKALYFFDTFKTCGILAEITVENSTQMLNYLVTEYHYKISNSQIHAVWNKVFYQV